MTSPLPSSSPRAQQPLSFVDFRFALAGLMPWSILAGALHSVWAAWLVANGILVGLALIEIATPRWVSPTARQSTHGWFSACLRVHVVWQGALLAVGLWAALRHHAVASADSASIVSIASAWLGVVAAGLAVGAATGSQGITYAHELGHSKSRLDRAAAWLLMTSVLYAHFMVEHYRGHHVRAATHDDPASARRGESLWRFLPRTLVGSLLSAWRLEVAQQRRLQRSMLRSVLVWATVAQAVWLVVLTVLLGAPAVLFWLVQSAYAVYLLETINYVEHYGLERRVVNGRAEPFAMQHAWNADAPVTNCVIANLQRHSDHHVHAWKPYPTLEDLPGPQLPYGYAACIFLATVPRRWFATMHPRLDAR
jgi:alkane 1-monooxygenase